MIDWLIAWYAVESRNVLHCCSNWGELTFSVNACSVTTCCRSDRATLSTTVAVDDRRMLPLRGTATLVARARTPDDDPAATGTAAAGIVVDAIRCRATTTDLAAASGAITADRGSGDGGDGRSSSWLHLEVDGRSSLLAAHGSNGAATASTSSHVDAAGWTRLTVVDSAMDPSSFNVSAWYNWCRTTTTGCKASLLRTRLLSDIFRCRRPVKSTTTTTCFKCFGGELVNPLWGGRNATRRQRKSAASNGY